MSEPTNGAMVPVQAPALPPAPNSVQAAVAMLGGADRPFYSSFDPASPAGKALLWQLNEGADAQVLESVNKVIDLHHVYAADAQKVDKETGEVKELVRIVLVDKSGKTYQCFSAGIRQSLRLLFASEGLPPYERPMLLEFGVKKLPNGQLLVLRPHVPEAAQPKGKAK